MHTVIYANEGVPSDIKFTSAATHDSFMLRPSVLNKGDIIAMDRAYIDDERLEMLAKREIMYVTKMKKNLKYNRRLYVPDRRRSYGGTYTKCNIL